MHDRWQVGGFPEEIWLLRGLDAGSAPPDAVALSGEAASLCVDSWFPETGAARDLLVEIVCDVHDPVLLAPIDAGNVLRVRIGEALLDGRLRAFLVRAKVSGGSTPRPGPTPKPPDPQPVEKKTWIMIELMDDSDPPKPVPMKKYKVELPDGSTREGLLDMNGQAMIKDIEAGTCKVSFPQLHGEDWQPA
jgi:hypothetical protein